MRYFSIDRDASQVAALSGRNRNTITRHHHGMCIRIAQVCENQSPLSGQVTIDASFFGARRVKGKRGRGAYGKTIVFGFIKRQKARYYTQIVPDWAKSLLQAIIRGKVDLNERDLLRWVC